MEFGKHLNKGIWGAADKALPVVYGFGYVVLVIRVLPKEEFGNFVLIQELFLIISGLAMAFALQPLLKFGAEERPDRAEIISAALFLNILFVIVFSVLSVVVRRPLGELLNSAAFGDLMLYMPALLVASLVRNFSLTLLQTRFMMQQVFWTDAAHFLGAVALIALYNIYGTFDSALDLIIINLMSLSLSSLIGLLFVRSWIRISLRPHRESLVLLWNYGKYSLGSLSSFFVYTKVDSFFLSAFSGPVQVAVYNSVKVFLRIFDTMAQVIQMFILPATSRISARGEWSTLKIVAEKSIWFATLGLLPVFFLFLFFPSTLLTLIGEQYADAILFVQIFSVLALITPLHAVAANILMGLGHAKPLFYLSMQLLVVSVFSYMILIPLLGALGATIGYVAASLFLTWIMARALQGYVPLTLKEVVGRTHDVKQFIRSRLVR